MRRAVLLVFTAAALGCSTARVQADGSTVRPPSHRAIVAQALRSSVRVHVVSGGEMKRAATGVVIESSGGPEPISYVVTNEHVVEKTGLGEVSFQVLVDGRSATQTYPAKLLAEGSIPAMDLAVLAVPGVQLPPAMLATDDEVAVGDDVLVVGAPYGKGLSISHGMLSQVELSASEPAMLKTDAPVGYGASGGGIFDLDNGHLLGIIEGYRTAQVQIPGQGGTAGWTFDVPMPGETFASSVAKVRRFFAEKRVPGQVGREAVADAAPRP
jgi:serine protease Do